MVLRLHSGHLSHQQTRHRVLVTRFVETTHQFNILLSLKPHFVYGVPDIGIDISCLKLNNLGKPQKIVQLTHKHTLL